MDHHSVTVEDLAANDDFLDAVATGDGLKAGRGTVKGTEFITFISSPLDHAD